MGQVIAVEQNPAGRRLLEPDEQLCNRALTAAALADKRDKLVLGDGK